MTWWLGRMAAFDLETTAADPMVARIVQPALCFVGGDAPVSKSSWLVCPEVEIPAEAAAIHGITTERARADGVPLHSVLPSILGALDACAKDGWPLVIYNAPYDLTVLREECKRTGVDWLSRLPLIVDPLVIDKFIDRYRKGSRKLADVCAFHGVSLDKAHDATSDALAAARLAYKMGPKLNHPIQDLQLLQAAWFRSQAEGLDSYWRKKGDKRRVDSFDWPIRLNIHIPWTGEANP